TDWTYGVSSVDAEELLSYLEGQIGSGELAPGLLEEITNDVAAGIGDEIIGDVEDSILGFLTGDDENAPQDMLWYAGDDGTQESFVGNVTITSAYNDQDYSKAKQIFLLAGRVEDNKALISRVDAISVSRDEALAQSLSLISV
ncbi:phage tail protein, partial [Vibrio anguillarum]|nr:phage tail protein [Vibrio anguillarum]